MFLFAVLALFPLSLLAKTVTFTVDNPAAIYLFNTYSYESINFDGQTSIQLELAESAGIQVGVNSGYELAGVSVDGTALSVSSDGQYLQSSDMPDGCTVSITTKEKEAKVIYVQANPDHVKLVENYTNVYDAVNIVDGQWTVQVTNEYGSLSIECYESYVITYVQDGNGNDLLSSYSLFKQSASLYLGSIDSGTTITIGTANLADLRDVHVSLSIVDGTAEQVEVRRNSDYQPVPPSEYSDIALYPAADLPLTISSPTYGMSLYQVLVNGEPQAPQGSTFVLYNLENGDEIAVYPNFPAVDVPVTFTFTNEGTEGAVRSVSIDHSPVDASVWQAEGFTVAMGSLLGVEYNTSDYNISSVTLNGENSATYGYQAVVDSETPLNFVITAEKLRDWQVTLYYVPGTVEVWNSSGSYGTQVELPEGADEYTVTVSPSNPYLYFKAAEGYLLTSIINDATQEDLLEQNTNPICVNSDMILYIYTEEFNRDLECVVYLEDTSWGYTMFLLSPNVYDNRKEIALEPGYNFVNYADSDRPFGISAYTAPDYATGVVYLNGEIIENQYGTYPALEDMEPNSVIKIFSPATEVSNYALTLAVPEDADIDILADYITPIESSVATVLGPSDVLFTSNEEGEMIVKVNGVQLAPGEDGRLIAHITEDSSIEVSFPTSGIIDINNTHPSVDVIYNLQGIPVQNPGHGLYIINGKKVKL